MKNIKLNNGMDMPMLGLGTYKIGQTDVDVYNAVRSAIDTGYRHIDTATLYRNEGAIGKAIRESGVSRKELFVTTKVWGSDIMNGNTRNAFQTSLELLNIDYIDMYLVHWPVRGMEAETWLEMEKIHATGLVKAIGVSNHLEHHLEKVLSVATIKPVANQIEMHPYLPLDGLVEYCRERDIVCEAWSPIGSNKIPLLDEPVLKEIGDKYSKSPAQVILRWDIERGVVAIPKSGNKQRQADNINIFDFELTKEEVEQISSLNRNYRTGAHPDEIEI